MTDESKPSRAPISKSLRFEVFKRDSFKCQYCGAEAPNVLLHVDHIHPVVRGGKNDITNLITACEPCNLGKRGVPLDDHAAVNKSRTQLEELQLRREQLELMMNWREGLLDIREDSVQRLAEYWLRQTPGYGIKPSAKREIEKWLKKYSLADICQAMDAAAAYLEFEEDGPIKYETLALAFQKIPRICSVNRAAATDPDLRQLLYIRGIVRNQLSGRYFNDVQALQYLRAARTWDISLDDLSQIARSARSWTTFVGEIEELIKEAQQTDADIKAHMESRRDQTE